MADQNIKVKIDLDVAEFKKNAEALSAAISNVLGKDIDLFAGKLKKTAKQADEAAKAVGGTATAVGKAGNTVKKSNQQWTNLALVIQDLPYGFRGIQNNLPALIGGIAGVGGAAYLAFSAIIAGFTFWDEAQRKATAENKKLKESQDEFTESLIKSTSNAYGEIASIKSLIEVAKNQGISMDKRIIAVKKLQDEYPAYFGNLSREKILNGDVADAIDGVTVSLIARAKASAIESKIGEMAAQDLSDSEKKNNLQNENNKLISERIKLQNIVDPGDELKTSEYILNNYDKIVKAEARLVVITGIVSKNNAEIDKLTTNINNSTLKQISLQYTLNGLKSDSINLDQEATKPSKPKKISDKPAKDAAKLAAFAAKRVAKAGGDIEVIIEPKIDPKAQAKAFNDKMAFDKKMSKERVDLLKEQYQIEVSEAQGSFDQIKIAEENMRNALNQGFMDGSIKLDEYLTAINDLRKKSNKTVLDESKAAMQDMLKMGIGIMNALGPALDMLLEKGASIGEVLSKALNDVIKKLIKVAIAAAIAVALLSLIFPSTVAKAGGAGKMFGNLIGGGMGLGTQLFANGGIVSGPTLGMVGEYPGAQSNPEVIAPLDKLKSMIGGGGNGSGEFVLRGQDLVLAMTRSNNSLNLRR